MRFIFHGLGSRTADRCLGAGLLNPSDPGARPMQAMEDIERPFVHGGGELASEGAATGGDDKVDRSATVRVTAQGLRELNDVCGARSRCAPATSTILAKRRTRASASICAVLRTSSEVSVPRATIVTSRCSDELLT
jgi:hypothetical protein